MVRAMRFIHKISVPLLGLCIILCFYNYVIVPDTRMFILRCDVWLKEALVNTYQYFGRVTCVELLETALHIGSLDPPAFYSVGRWVSPCWPKRKGRVAEYYPRAVVRNEWSYTSTPLMFFRVVYRDKFIFLKCIFSGKTPLYDSWWDRGVEI